jgi:hypothetical protein
MRGGNGVGKLRGEMTCSHCKREVEGVTAIYSGKPAVCGRADCLLWARHLIVALPAASDDTPPLRIAA